MKKSKKKRIGVVLSFLILLVASVCLISYNVLANEEYDENVTEFDKEGTTKWLDFKPSSCTDNVEELENYYGINYEIDANNGNIKITCDKGAFKITAIRSGHFKEYPNILNLIYVSGDGKMDYSNGIIITVPRDQAQSLVIDFELTETDDVCYSKADFDAHKNDADGAKYGTFTTSLQLELPVLNATVTTTLDNSEENLALCAKFDSGDVGGLGEGYKEMYKNTPEAKAYYNDFLGSACSQKVDFVLNISDLKLLMTSVIRSYDAKLKAESPSYFEGSSTSDWSFDFEAAKKSAIDSGHAYYVEKDGATDKDKEWYVLNKDGTRTKVDNTFSLKCKFDGKSENDISNLFTYAKYDPVSKTYTQLPEPQFDSNNPNSFASYNIYANQQYYYAKNESTHSANYTWTYTSGNKKQEDVFVCSRVCEEVVEVDYGPPVASTAAFCFEYQVQVSSKVKCVTKPDTEYELKMPEICNPVPICNNTVYYRHQGGSIEEFDSCIQSCDGGKFTKDCSNKCYSEVYKSGNDGAKKSAYSVGNALFEKLASGVSFDGEYTYNASNDVISWTGKYTYARYYRDSEYYRTVGDHGRYLPLWGFKRRYYGNGNYCKDGCYFSRGTCTANSYLNYREAYRDYVNNLSAYNTAKAECLAAASCTSKTANFKINVSYTDRDTNEDTTIYFPYTKSNSEDTKDLLKSEDNKNCNNYDLGNDSKNHVLLRYDGCYKSCDDNPVYHARWSFPLAYRDRKHLDEVKYITGNTTGYKAIGHKFCIPVNAKDVNVNWWIYFNAHNEENIKSSEVCSWKETSRKYSVNETEIDYNIKAEAENFGHFGWNLNISCFYALNSETPIETSNEGHEICTIPSPNNYRVRSVDLKTLFPQEKDSVTSSGNRSNNIGFNWSGYSQYIGKVENPIMPSTYADVVEKINYNVYSEDYLDYEFNLTKSQLRKIKNTTIDISPVSLYGDNGVYSYHSKLIDDYASKRPSSSVFGCNNIKNYKATTCLNTSDLYGLAGSVVPGGGE